MTESKHDAFKRLLAVRMPKATTALRTIAQLGTARYEWTEQEAQAFISVLQKHMDAIRQAFGIHDVDAPPAAPEPVKDERLPDGVKAVHDGQVITHLMRARRSGSDDEIRAALKWLETRKDKT